MTDKKLTDEEIIKALECMLGMINNDVEYSINCRGCAFEDNTLCSEICSDGVAKAALELINRQKAEIEKLKSNYNKLCKYAEKKEFELVEINADISWFREAKISRLAPAIKQIKVEACKEFAKRLKKIVSQNDYLLADKLNSLDRGMFTIGFEQAIDEILKEMVGEDE